MASVCVGRLHLESEGFSFPLVDLQLIVSVSYQSGRILTKCELFQGLVSILPQ